MQLLRLSNQEFKQTIIIVTHDENVAAQADRIIEVSDGQIARDERLV